MSLNNTNLSVATYVISLLHSSHPRDYEQRQDFYRLVEFYGMTPGIYPTVIELHRGEPNTAQIGEFPDCFVKSSEWSTFTIQTLGHKRDITSFEVVLGNVERMQIGWINESRYVENLSEGAKNGVGEEENSLALDCCRGGLLNQGEFTKLDGLSIGAGSVIRCEQKGHVSSIPPLRLCNVTLSKAPHDLSCLLSLLLRTVRDGSWMISCWLVLWPQTTAVIS